MANILPSFASGSNSVIVVDGITLAYATNLSFTDDMSHAAVGGIGSYSYDTIEPTQYAVRGNITIMQYSAAAVAEASAIATLSPTSDKKGSTVTGTPARMGGVNGNSFLVSKYFSPVMLLLQQTFDIDVYERQVDKATGNLEKSTSAIFQIQNCRLNSYNLTFTPGSLISENLTFSALGLIDLVAQSALITPS